MGHPEQIARQKATTDAVAVLDTALSRAQTALDEAEAKALISAAEVRVPRGVRLSGSPVTPADLEGLTPPFALKALSSAPLHKSDLGAVRLGLTNSAELTQAMTEIAARLTAVGAAGTGFLVEEMALPGVEIVIGGLIDAQLGPAVMLGAGGIHAEIMKDATFRLCPISATDARAMIDALRIAPILKGARGKPAVDLEAIVTALMALAGADGVFTRHAGRITEFDLNPLIARHDGLIAVDARIVLGTAPVAAAVPAPEQPDFARLFQPRNIAVAGASASGMTAGNRFIRQLKATGYDGHIFPIHPTAAKIEGLPAYADLTAMPEPADYAYLTVPAGRVADVLGRANGRVGFAQVMASAGHDDEGGWERDLVALARKQRLRIIGPNCMGTHSPHGRFTFMEGALIEVGSVGIACQSGGLGMDILRRGQELGLRFSGLVTIGNSIDIQPADLIEHYMADPQTRVIGLYVEDLRDGRRFVELARRNAGRTPIVVLVGGLTTLGRAAAASHTGAMGGSAGIWRALAAQTGIIVTETLDQFLDQLLLCQCLTPRPETAANGITLFGNGGGASVLASDAIDRNGLTLAQLPELAVAAFAEIDLPPGTSLNNPIDLPASVLKEREGRVAASILDINRRHVKPHATIVHLNLPVIMGYRHIDNFLPNLLTAVFGTETDQAEHLMLVLRSDRSEEVDAWRRTFRAAAIQRNVATFDEVPQAIEAFAAFREYELSLTGAQLPLITGGTEE